MSGKKHILRWLKRLGPWTVAAGLLAYVFRTVPFGRTWEAAQAVGPASLILMATVYFIYSYTADVVATWATFRWFCAPLRFWDVVAIRGATYLLAIVNYNLGQGGIVYVVGKNRGVGVRRATGTVLLTMGVMFVALLMLAGIGSLIGDGADPRLRAVRWVSGLGLSAFVLYLVIIKIRPRFLARREVLKPLFDAGLIGHAKAWLVRFPHVAGHIVFQWLLLRLFHVDLPFGAAAMLLPIIFVISWIPITVQGLGTQQVAALELLGRYSHAAAPDLAQGQIVAFSLAQSALFAAFSLVTGLICLRAFAVARDVQRGAATAETEPL
ncbi:MAG TPA: hypothetical protein VGQ83_39270 [Polyangia bacterium]|jgi:hypothetical protein